MKKNLIIITFLMAVIPIVLSGQWNIENVDTAGTVGVKCSIAVDSSGYPHISYRDGALKYAHWDGSQWQTAFIETTESVYGVTSIALDNNNNPHITYELSGQQLWHAWWDGSNWQQEGVDSLPNNAVDVGYWNSIAFGTDGYPRIAYTYSVGSPAVCYLKYAYKDVSGWHTQIVDSLINDEFQYVSMALDNSNHPHISYYDWNVNDLKYAFLEVSLGDTLWTKVYGGSSYDVGASVQQTTDGGYIIGGRTNSYGPDTPNYPNAYLIKTDSLGDTLWTGNYNGSSNVDVCYSVQQTSDNGYILVGYSFGYLYGYDDVFLVKTDSLGNALWQKGYGDSTNDEGKSVQQTADGGYIITGRCDGPVWTPGGNVYLIKADSIGDTLWTKVYGGDSTDYGNSVRQTSDGGYIITGYTKSFGAGEANVWLLKTDSLGDTLWTKVYGGDSTDYGNSVRQTSDGGYIIVGNTKSFGAGEQNVWLLKTDSIGDTLWAKVYDYWYSSGASDIQITQDNNYIITGGCRISSSDSLDVLLMKINPSGDTLWTKTFGGNSTDGGASVQQTSNGGYIIAGYTKSFGAGDYDAYLINVKPDMSIWHTERVDTAGGVGEFSSIALDSLNNPDIAYWDGSNSYLKYAQWNGTNWQIEVVDSPAYVYNPSISMVLNVQDNPHIAYMGEWNALKYAHWDGINWHIEVVDSNVSSEWASLKIDNNGYSHIAYYDGDSTNLKYAKGIPSGIEERFTVKTSSEFFCVYPNPFRRGASIQYTLPSLQRVNLKVYNIAGQLVKTIVNNKTQTEGKHTLYWDGINNDGKRLQNGVYFLYLQRGDMKNIKKLIFLR